ncbi:hypothetical protein [Ralstonia pseudosolanacearum]|jgi:hypothetical protein|uniref:hypothetical protein n=1 Tax=Ralstonia pseudosolanacearum TaxID=1310165 RepID=UPI0011CDEF81|nr:hypothetical protein [Ralstonia pseudosolanacearum]
MLTSTAVSTQVDVGKLSERALRRLRITARVLQQRGMRFSADRKKAVGEVLDAARQQADAQELKSIVDWLEAFESTPPTRTVDDAQRWWQRSAEALRAQGTYELIASGARWGQP